MMNSTIALLVIILLQSTGVLAENCSLDVSEYSDCTAVNCSGLACQPQPPFQNWTASYYVTNCVDPVAVDLSITPSDSSLEGYSAQFNSSQTIHFGTNNNIHVQLTRNATHLDFQATIFHNGEQPVVLFPEIFIPLFPDHCMCSSLESLAQSSETIHPSIESNCSTTRSCTGFQCDLTISLFFQYVVELVVLSCENGLEVIFRDKATGDFSFSKRYVGPTSGITNIFTGYYYILLYMNIEVGDYSMTVQAFLFDEFLGLIEIIPRATIILDKTQCIVPQFPTVTPHTAPPPPTLPPNSPPLCAYYQQIVESVYNRSLVLRCELKANCERGIDCVLSIGHEVYALEIAIDNYRHTLRFSVTSFDGTVVYGYSTGENTTVELPRPQGTALLFSEVFDYYLFTIGFVLSLQFSFLTNTPQIEELIPYTHIKVGSGSSTETILVIFVLPFISFIIICSVIVCVVCCLCKKRKRSRGAFDFMRMSDVQESEKELDTSDQSDSSPPSPGENAASASSKTKKSDPSELY